MLESSNILITGGAGTFGHALARRRKADGWTGKLTVYSTDTHKHELMRREYPDINFVQGDIRTGEILYNAMCGHDVVIHAAAVKVIPASEFNSIDTFDVNVNGSRNVCACAITANIKHLIGISTDKACHAVNAYGASKYMMEKVFQEYSRQPFDTQFHLVRFGNVLESNGSVIESWRRAFANGEPIKMTDPAMSRFWLSPSQAVQCAMDALEFPSGYIYIPKLPALSLGKLAEYAVWNKPGEEEIGLVTARIPVRPGEKVHEELLTQEEGWYAAVLIKKDGQKGYILCPTTTQRNEFPLPPYSSDIAPELTKIELSDLLANG